MGGLLAVLNPAGVAGAERSEQEADLCLPMFELRERCCARHYQICWFAVIWAKRRTAVDCPLSRAKMPRTHWTHTLCTAGAASASNSVVSRTIILVS